MWFAIFYTTLQRHYCRDLSTKAFEVGTLGWCPVSCGSREQGGTTGRRPLDAQGANHHWGQKHHLCILLQGCCTVQIIADMFRKHPPIIPKDAQSSCSMESINLSAALRLTPGPIRAVCKSTKVAPNLFVVASSSNLLKTKCRPLCNLPNLFSHAHGQCFTLAVGLGSISYTRWCNILFTWAGPGWLFKWAVQTSGKTGGGETWKPRFEPRSCSSWILTRTRASFFTPWLRIYATILNRFSPNSSRDTACQD